MNYGDYTYIEWYEGGGGNMLPPAGTPRSMNYFSIWLRPVQTAKGLKGQYEELKDLRVGHAPFAMRMALHEMNELIENGMSEEDFQLNETMKKEELAEAKANGEEETPAPEGETPPSASVIKCVTVTEGQTAADALNAAGLEIRANDGFPHLRSNLNLYCG